MHGGVLHMHRRWLGRHGGGVCVWGWPGHAPGGGPGMARGCRVQPVPEVTAWKGQGSPGGAVRRRLLPPSVGSRERRAAGEGALQPNIFITWG